MEQLVEIFCDGNDQIGFGHIRRSSALAAKLLQENIPVRLSGLSETARRILPAPVDIQTRATITVFDSLTGIDTQIREAQKKGQLTITLDWFGETVPDINIAVFAHSEVKARKQYYTGFEYIIIRDEIIRLPKKVQKDIGNKVLICLGGGDLLGQAAIAAHILSDRGFDVTLVQGPFASPTEQHQGYRTLINPPDFPQLLAGSDWAVVNGAGCFFETLCLGRPSFVLPQTDMEWKITQFAEERDTVLGIGLENLKIYQPGNFEQVSRKGMKLVDGGGLNRIATIIKNSL